MWPRIFRLPGGGLLFVALHVWGTFGGPRAYTKWIQPDPTPNAESISPPRAGEAAVISPPRSGEPVAPTSPPRAGEAAAISPPRSGEGLGEGLFRLPPRPAGAIEGTQFVTRLEGMSLADREAAILREITSGNFPDFLRSLKTIRISGTLREAAGEKQVTVSLAAMRDYLSVGSDANFVRMPMTPQTAQQIADRFGCILPTRKIVDAIDQLAEVRLAPHPLTEAREAVATFLQHHQIIEEQRAGQTLGLLLTGIKKDIVLSPRIFERPGRLAIYGWRQLNGKPIQPLSIVHGNRYVDYSHGVRLVRNSIQVEERTIKITDALADPNLCGLVSDEGPMEPPAYPLE